MIASIASTLPTFAFIVLAIVLVAGILIFCALRMKGDVLAELSRGKTTFRIDARDRRNRRKL